MNRRMNIFHWIQPGVLRTTKELDYESRSSFQIRVRGTSTDGSVREKTFTVIIEDVLETIWTKGSGSTPSWGDNWGAASSAWVLFMMIMNRIGFSDEYIGWAYKGIADYNSTWIHVHSIGWVWTR